jgi:hypothetical protein
MTTIPEGAKAPQDHKTSRVEQFNEGLAGIGLTEGILPTGLRPRQRNEVMDLAFELRDLVGAEAGEDAVDVDTENLSDEQTKKLLDIIATFDELMQREAIDGAAYDAWSRLAGYDDFSTLLTQYAGVLGESTSSAS